MIIGRLYCYFAKGYSDKKPRIKFGKLVSYNNTHAVIEREDLTIHKMQSVRIHRLREVMRKKNEQDNQERLPL